MDTIIKWLTPPRFEDPNKNRAAQFLHYLLLSALILLGAFLVYLIAAGDSAFQPSTWQMLGVLWLVLLGLEISVHHGYVLEASYAFILSSWLALNWQAWNATGIHDTAFMANFIIIVITALLLGWRAAVAITALTIGYGYVLAYTETYEIITYQEISPAFSSFRDMAIIFTLVILTLSLTIASLENAIKRARASEESLANANEELRKVQEGLEAHVAEQTRDLTLATEIGQDISQIRDLDQLLATAVERIRSHFDLYYAQIYLLNQDNTLLILRAGTGAVGKALLARNHQLDLDSQSISGLAVQDKRPLIVTDTAQSPLFRPNPLLPYTRSEMAVPLIISDKVLGVLDLQSTTPDSLNEDNLTAFETLAGQLAITIENASLFREQQRLASELQDNTRQFQENASFLDTIIENIPTMLFVKHADDLRYLRWNKAGARLIGVAAEEFIGKTDYDFFPKDEADFFAQKDREILENGVVVDIPEETIETVDKGTRLLHTIKVPILDTEGKPLYLLGISQDITEQKEAERMLNERVKVLNLLNEIGRKAEEQLPLDEFLTYIANQVPNGMQYPELCQVAITVGTEIYGNPQSIDLPHQIVKGLRVEGEQVGQIYIAYTENKRFLNEENALIGNIGGRISDYIASRRLLNRVQATVEGLQTVAEVGTAITSQQDTQQLLQNIVDLTKTQFNFYHAQIYLYDAAIAALALAAGAGETGRQIVSESQPIPLATPQSLIARSARERRSLVVADAQTDPDCVPHPLLPGTRSELAVPLSVGEQLIGVMDIQSSEKDGFSSEDINIQTTLASQIAVALQNAEQHERTQAALDEVNALQRTLTREGWQAYMTAINRPTKGFKTSQNEIQPILSHENHQTKGNDDDDKNIAIAYPLSVRGTAIGQIGVTSKGKPLSDDDLELLESISEQVAEALERARLFEETEVARSQTEALFTGSENVVRSTSLDEILQSLVKATALKHMERVTLLLFDEPWQENPPNYATISATWLNEGMEGLVEIGTTYAIDQYPLLQALHKDSPFIIDDFATEPRIDENSYRLLVEELGLHTAITIPLVSGEQWIGIVLGLSSVASQIGSSDLRQIISLAGQAATMAQSQQLYQAAQSRAQHEQILREVSARVSAAVDAESVLQTATREIGRALGLETFVYLKKTSEEQ
ncbi:MAG: hypothetical protein CSB13_02325 [Chloroflexi bacterium]|nr:MAG: hypothetical protein CSB13_02325 [Chloroflexota bacterium]